MCCVFSILLISHLSRLFSFQLQYIRITMQPCMILSYIDSVQRFAHRCVCTYLFVPAVYCLAQKPIQTRLMLPQNRFPMMVSLTDFYYNYTAMQLLHLDTVVHTNWHEPDYLRRQMFCYLWNSADGGGFFLQWEKKKRDKSNYFKCTERFIFFARKWIDCGLRLVYGYQCMRLRTKLKRGESR